MASRECFGAYGNGDGCDGCPLVPLCIDATIQADAYYDELARKEEWRWAYEADREDARIQDALENR